MGSKNKLKRFQENEILKNVIQPDRSEVLSGFYLKGKWQGYFTNKNPIVLELGCGKGEYSVSLAKQFPDKNFIGVDIKGARFWHGAKSSIEGNLTNIAFLRLQIELIDLCFSKNEISEIWITFPDPQIKYKRTKHRLINIEFLKKYQTILKDDGFVHLKTDSEFLHGYILGILQEGNHDIQYSNHDIYNSSSPPKVAKSIQTFYEKQYLNQKKAITYIKFRTNY